MEVADYGIIGQRAHAAISSFNILIFILVISILQSKIGRNTLSRYLIHGIITRGVSSFRKHEARLKNMVICAKFAVQLRLLLTQDNLTKILS